jgi:hypothetical protein
MINHPNSSAPRDSDIQHVLARKQLCFAAGGLWAALDYFFLKPMECVCLNAVLNLILRKVN